MAEVTTLGQAGVIGRGQADVARLRERNRQRRMQRSLAFFDRWRRGCGTAS
jgi:hypothetical protein